MQLTLHNVDPYKDCTIEASYELAEPDVSTDPHAQYTVLTIQFSKTVGKALCGRCLGVPEGEMAVYRIRFCVSTKKFDAYHFRIVTHRCPARRSPTWAALPPTLRLYKSVRTDNLSVL